MLGDGCPKRQNQVGMCRVPEGYPRLRRCKLRPAKNTTKAQMVMKEMRAPVLSPGVEYLIVMVWALSSTGIAMKPTFAFSISTGCPSRVADQPSE